jgi:hypothetical protein
MRAMKSGLRTAVSLGVLGGALIVSSPARADEVVTRETIYVGPNRALLWSGVVTVGIPYVASAVVGGESAYAPDRALFIPIAGPWVDLSQRSGCPVSASSCNTETLNKVLLVGDGLFQGIGALTILSAFLFPERGGVRARVARPELHVTPISLYAGGGLAAFGTF